jgi:hypothetical protein
VRYVPMVERGWRGQEPYPTESIAGGLHGVIPCDGRAKPEPVGGEPCDHHACGHGKCCTEMPYEDFWPSHIPTITGDGLGHVRWRLWDEGALDHSMTIAGWGEGLKPPVACRSGAGLSAATIGPRGLGRKTLARRPGVRWGRGFQSGTGSAIACALTYFCTVQGNRASASADLFIR